jgi:hypothetical protein
LPLKPEPFINGTITKKKVGTNQQFYRTQSRKERKEKIQNGLILFCALASLRETFVWVIGPFIVK